MQFSVLKQSIRELYPVKSEISVHILTHIQMLEAKITFYTATCSSRVVTIHSYTHIHKWLCLWVQFRIRYIAHFARTAKLGMKLPILRSVDDLSYFLRHGPSPPQSENGHRDEVKCEQAKYI